MVQYQQRYDLSDLFRLFGKADTKVIKVDLGLEAPKLCAGQALFSLTHLPALGGFVYFVANVRPAK